MKKTIFLLFTLSMAAVSSMGQTIKTYSGLYEDGKATYSYYEDENGERVKHGKFTYNKTQKGVGVGVGAIGGASISYTGTDFASGNYKDGIKDGTWTYKSKVTGGKIVFGNFAAVINYVNGRMEGTLNYDGKIYQMKNNRITGQVKKSDEDWTISGQFDEDGFPDGTWTKKYQSGGNLYVDTEKYVHGLLIDKQTKNESTGEITKYEFKDVDPHEYLAAYDPNKDSTIVGKLICKEKIYLKQGENNWSPLQEGLLPEVFGVDIRTIVEKIQEKRGFGSEQDEYEGIPFKEIVPIRTNEASDKVYNIVEQMPKFPGGEEALMKFINEHIKYPQSALEQGTQGTIMLRFVVTGTGDIGEVQILKGLDPDCDDEAKRVVKSLPKFNPGMQQGRPVSVWYTAPVRFVIE